jgi:D-arabinonate dehydratase
VIPATTERRVTRVEAWNCEVPMPWPVRLGSVVYNTRDFVVVQLTCDDGLSGRAVGYSRGTPLLEAVRGMAPFVGMLNVAEPEQAQAELSGLLLSGWAQFVRAASLIDIALWDVKAQAEELPLHRLLGAELSDVPVMAVSGYFSDVRSQDELVEEAIEFDRAGMGAKLILGGYDSEWDQRLVHRIREALSPGTEIGVDFHARWRDPEEAASYFAPMDELGLRFIEDPFPGFDWRAMRDLANRIKTPVAAGEDVIGYSALLDLLESVKYLRLDATASGGVSTALKAINAAADRGAVVAPHVFPYIHAVLCAAHEAVANIEVITASVGADPMDRLLTDADPIRNGRWVLDDEPGLTLPLDWTAIEEMSTASFVWNAAD